MGRSLKRVAVVAALLAVVLGASVVVGTGYFARNSPAASARACAPVAQVMVGKIIVPAGPIAGYCQDRLINAAYVMMAARSLGIGPHTQAIGVMTALGESGLRVLDHGDAAGADSRGLFQQRDNGAWGTYADRMDPYTSALNFFRKLVSIPGWKDLSPGEAAHTVQVNADPQHYDPYLPRAEAIVAALGS
ncbi:MAG: hypothetical protein H7201_17190 [Candidatus Saccharibacteria bacterium]|nr:hypothetical protein [Microbacteriaceae bacterium]